MVRFDVSPCPVLRLALPLHSILLCRLISVECGLYNGGGEGRGKEGTYEGRGSKNTHEGDKRIPFELLSFPAMIGMPTLCPILRSRISSDEKDTQD